MGGLMYSGEFEVVFLVCQFLPQHVSIATSVFMGYNDIYRHPLLGVNNLKGQGGFNGMYT